MTTWTRRGRLRQYLDTAVWPIPTAYLLVACVLGVGVPAVDRALGDAVPAEFGVGAAQAVLAAFATGLITVMGFIISVVLAGLTFGGTTVTPRIVREMQRNTTIRHVFGLLLLSVVYAFLVLNRVAPPSNPDYVPDLAVWLVVPLLVFDVIGLFVLVREMGHALRLVEIIDKVHHRVERVITTIYREPLGADGDGDGSEIPVSSVDSAVVIRNEESPGVVANLDVETLVAEAVRVDTTATLACAIGSYVPTGRALIYVADALPGLDGQRLCDAVTLADERTIDQDPLYALRLLVDIATRALSPAVNDPTTAVQTLDRIEAILELLANRRLDQGTIRDDQGKVRLIIPLPSWEDFLAVSLTEIRHYGATSAQVMRRQRALLDDLILDAPPSRRPALQEQLTLLDQTIARSWPDATERELALVADRHGLGEPGAVRGSNRPQAQVLARDAALRERHE
jgi:uncharacterized membrane protein